MNVYAVTVSAEVGRSAGGTRLRAGIVWGKKPTFVDAVPAAVASDPHLRVRPTTVAEAIVGGGLWHLDFDAQGSVVASHIAPDELASSASVPPDQSADRLAATNPAKPDPQPPPSPPPIPHDLSPLSYNALKKLAAANRLDPSGKREELQARLAAARS